VTELPQRAQVVIIGCSDAGGEAVDAAYLASGRWEIEVACDRIPAAVSLKPFYDPAGRRVKETP
jgi:4-methylaminobutanoate oxidase (formaldehyde-forming)